MLDKTKLALVTLVFFLSIAGTAASVYAEVWKPRSISIFFAQRPPRVISQAETYRVRVFWWNWNPKRSYEGYFLFRVEGRKFEITSDDITFTFGGSVISPQEMDGSLVYRLPQQTFPARKYGIISVEVVYNRPGRYFWKIGIIEM